MKNRVDYQARRAAERETNLRVLMAPSRALVRGSYTGASSGVVVEKAPEAVRSERHRRLVAGLPCFHCRIQGYSQAAHPNSGKAKGKKTSDADCFPLCCDRPGVVGCHARFDRYELVPRAEMPAFEARALAWTTQLLTQQPDGTYA